MTEGNKEFFVSLFCVHKKEESMGVLSYTVLAYAMTAVISYMLMGVVVLVHRITGAKKTEDMKEEGM